MPRITSCVTLPSFRCGEEDALLSIAPRALDKGRFFYFCFGYGESGGDEIGRTISAAMVGRHGALVNQLDFSADVG